MQSQSDRRFHTAMNVDATAMAIHSNIQCWHTLQFEDAVPVMLEAARLMGIEVAE